MGDPTKRPRQASGEGRPRARSSTWIQPQPRVPRWGFWKGLLTGAVLEVPILAAGVWVLAHLGLGDRTVPFMQVFRLTAIFAGIAAVFTAAGLGRLAAHAS